MTFFMLRVWLYHEKENIAELEDILWSVCDEYSWAVAAHMPGIMTDDSVSPNTVDLFAAETAHTVAETLSLVGDELHPLVKKRCVQKYESMVNYLLSPSVLVLPKEKRKRHGLVNPHEYYLSKLQ